jgi:transcriptional regulator with PAS, ATPase and Fis domain
MLSEGVILHSRLSTVVDEMIQNKIDLKLALQEMEAMYIQKVLRQNEGNISLTALRLGLHRNTLTRKIRQLSIHK